MKDFGRLKKYFTYNDNLSVIVSVITGIFIVLFNLTSGFTIIKILETSIWGIQKFSIETFIYYPIPMIIFASSILKLCLTLIKMMLNGVEIEDYPYLRLILFLSIIFYLLILIFYIFFSMLYGIKFF